MRRLLGIVLGVTVMAAPVWAMDITSNSGTNVDSTASDTTTAGSTISGDGFGVSSSYTINTGHTITNAAGQTVTINGDGSGGSGSLINNDTYINKGTTTVSGTATDGGVVDNQGIIINEGALTLGAGSAYQGTGSITTNAGSAITLDAGMTGMDAAFGDIDLTNGTLSITNTGGVATNVTTPLVIGDGDSALSVSVDGGDITFGNGSGTVAINVDESKLVINGADNVFNGSITSANTALDAVEVKANTTFNDAVNGNLTVTTGGATFGTGATFGGTTMTVTAGGTAQNNSTTGLTFGSGKTLDNAGAFTNSGKITFESGSTYTGAGTLTQTSASAETNLDTSVTGFDDAFSAMDLQGGALNITGTTGYTAAGGLTLNAGTGGAVNIKTTAGSTFGDGTDAIDVKGSKLNVVNNTVFDGDVASTNTADDAITVNNGATFKQDVGGNLNVAGGTAIMDTNSSLTNGGLKIANGASVQNDATSGITIGTGKTFDNTGTFTNNTELTFGSGSTYVSNGNAIITNGAMSSNINVDTNTTGIGDAFGDIDLSAGTVTLTGNSAVTDSLVLKTGGANGTVIVNSAGSTYGGTTSLDAKGSKIDVTGAGNVFSGQVKTTNGATDAIKTGANTTFNGAVDGNLNVAAGTTTLGTGSSFGGTVMTVDGGSSVTNNSTGGIVFGAGKKLDNAGTFTNVGSLTLGAGSTYTGVGAIVQNTAGAETNLDTGVNGFINAYQGVNLQNGNLNITGSAGYTAGVLGFTTAATGGTVNLKTTGQQTFGDGANAFNLDAAKLNVAADVILDGDVVTTNTATDAIKVDLGGNAVFNKLVNAGGTGGMTVVNGGGAVFADTASFTGNTIANSGAVTAYANNTALNSISSKMELTATGVYNLTTDATTTITAVDASVKSALANSKINYSSTGGSVLTIDGATVNGYNADMAVAGGTVEFINSGLGNVAVNTGSFTVANGATMRYDTGAVGGTTTISTLTDSTIAGTLQIGAKDTVAFDSLKFENGSRLVLAAAGGSNSLITANNVAGASKTVNVVLNGGLNEWRGQAFIESATAVDPGMFNAGRYVFGSVTGGGAFNYGLVGYNSTNGSMASVGMRMSRNKYNAGDMFDQVLADTGGVGPIGSLVDNRLQQIYNWALSGNRELAQRAYGQDIGEYAAYGREGIRTATDNMLHTVLRSRLDAEQDFAYGMNTFSSSRARSGSAYADLVPPNCYPARRGRTVRSGNGGYDFSNGGGTIWGDLHGTWTRQHGRSNIHGYDVNSGGGAVGYEHRFGMLTLGALAAYTRTNTDVNSLAAKFDGDVLNVALYAAYNHQSGFFGRAAFGFGYGWNDYDVDTVGGANKSGDFNNQMYELDLDFGYTIRTSFMNIVPQVGIRYAHLSQDSWNEGGGVIPLNFGRTHNDFVDFPIALRVNKVFDFGGFQIAPELRGSWIISGRRERSEISTRLTGTGYSTHMYGVNPHRNRWLLGAGIKARVNNYVDLNLDYNFEFRSRYRQHNLTAGVGVSF